MQKCGCGIRYSKIRYYLIRKATGGVTSLASKDVIRWLGAVRFRCVGKKGKMWDKIGGDTNPASGEERDRIRCSLIFSFIKKRLEQVYRDRENNG